MVLPVGPRFKFVGRALAPIGDPLVLVGSSLARIGHVVSLVCETLSLVKLAPPLLQSGGPQAYALGSFTNLHCDPTPLGGLIGLSELLERLRVLVNQSSATFDRLGRSCMEFEQGPWVQTWTHRDA